MSRIEPIRTEHLVLRDFVHDDWRAVHEYGSDAEVMRYMGLVINTEAASTAFVARTLESQTRRPRERYELAITLPDTGQLIGGCGIHVTVDRQRELTLGYILRRDCWGYGYATEAAQALLRLGFGDMGAHRIISDCDVDNLASARVMEKVGMQREGVLRQSFWSPPHFAWRDCYLYTILEDEWRAQQGT